MLGRGWAGADVVIPVRQVAASEPSLERPAELSQDFERARRRVVGVDLEAQPVVDVEVQQLVECPIYRAHDAPRGGLRCRRPDLLAFGVPGGCPALGHGMADRASRSKSEPTWARLTTW